MKSCTFSSKNKLKLADIELIESRARARGLINNENCITPNNFE